MGGSQEGQKASGFALQSSVVSEPRQHDSECHVGLQIQYRSHAVLLMLSET